MRLRLRTWLLLIVLAALVLVPIGNVVAVYVRSELELMQERRVLEDLGPQWLVHGRRVSGDKPLLIVLGRDYNRIGWLSVGPGHFDVSSIAIINELPYLGRLTFHDTTISKSQLAALHNEMPRLELEYTTSNFKDRREQLFSVVEVIEEIEIDDPSLDDETLSSFARDLDQSGGAKRLRVIILSHTTVNREAALSAQRRLHLDEIRALRNDGFCDWSVP